MSTNKTTHLNLHQWAQTDPIHRTEFNENFEHIDSAVGTLQTAIQTAGNCQVVYGTYTGTGTYGKAHPCTLTFPGKPVMLVVCIDDLGGSSPQRLIAVRNAKEAYSYPESFNSANNVTWDANSVSWYGYSVAYQCNECVTYHYVALLAADE